MKTILMMEGLPCHHYHQSFFSFLAIGVVDTSECDHDATMADLALKY